MISRFNWLKVTCLAVFILLATVSYFFINAKPSPYSRQDAMRSQLSSLTDALRLYKDEYGAYPSTSEGLEILYEKEYFGRRNYWIDPWGSKLVYEVSDGVLTLYSIGKNKIDERGEGDDISEGL